EPLHVGFHRRGQEDSIHVPLRIPAGVHPEKIESNPITPFHSAARPRIAPGRLRAGWYVSRVARKGGCPLLGRRSPLTFRQSPDPPPRSTIVREYCQHRDSTRDRRP